MGGMGFISQFTPVSAKHLLRPGLSGPMTSSSWTHSYSKQYYQKVRITRLRLSACPPPYTEIWDFTVVVKSCSKTCSVSYLLLMVMKHQPKHCSSYTTNPAWLQSSTRELWRVQQLLQFVISGNVKCDILVGFPKPITYKSLHSQQQSYSYSKLLLTLNPSNSCVASYWSDSTDYTRIYGHCSLQQVT